MNFGKYIYSYYNVLIPSNTKEAVEMSIFTGFSNCRLSGLLFLLFCFVLAGCGGSQNFHNRKADSFFDAVKNGNASAVKELATKKNNHVNSYYDGYTPLHIAAKKGQNEITGILISNGANVNMLSKVGSRPIHEAIMNNHPGIALVLLRNGAFYKRGDRSREYQTPMFMAVQKGHDEIVKELLGLGVSVNVKNLELQTPLYVAILSKQLETAAFLIRRNADVNAVSIDGMAVIHVAAMAGNLENIKFVLQHGADINQKGKDGILPFHLACTSGNIEIVKYLTDQGAMHITLTDDGMSGLHFASLGEHVELAKLLIAMGLDVNTRNLNDLASYHIAASNKHEDLFTLYLDNGADIYPSEDFPGITADTYKYAGHYYNKNQKNDMALGCFKNAVEYYEKTCTKYSYLLQKTERELRDAKVSAFVAGTLMTVVSCLAASYQAQAQARQMASVTGGSGVGVAHYQIYSTSISEEFANTFGGKIAKYRDLLNSRRKEMGKYEKIVDCFESGLTGNELNSCIDNNT
ncbi:MAG: ankyrin repeat domain-containing protein [Sedimentisphaerales bacterium]|nr:ankyrin repeat domain-containing protein [Sedimentisphaerales bacterium]